MSKTTKEPQGEPPSPPALHGNHSKVIRRAERGEDGLPGADFAWPAIDVEAYKETTESWRGVTRRELVGKRGESPLFQVRYFEIAPGGYSTLEKHRHEHVVVAQRGRGEVQFGRMIYRLEVGDVVYVAPDDPHQFRNPDDADEPFGFLCIVNAERDRPEPSEGLGACFICE